MDYPLHIVRKMSTCSSSRIESNSEFKILKGNFIQYEGTDLEKRHKHEEGGEVKREKGMQNVLKQKK